MEGIVIFAKKYDSCSLVGYWLFGCCRARIRQSNVSKTAYGWRWIWSWFLKWGRRTCSWNAWYATKGSGAVQLRPWTMGNRMPDYLSRITSLQISEYMIYFQFYCVIWEGVLIPILFVCDNGRLMNGEGEIERTSMSRNWWVDGIFISSLILLDIWHGMFVLAW